MHALSRSGLIFLVATLLISTTSLAVAAECATAEIAEPFTLPDGSHHDAGTLTLCFRQQLSPASLLHATYVNDLPVGLFTSHGPAAATEGGADNYFLLFDRRPGNILRLAGYAISRNDATQVYMLDRPAHVEIEDSILTSAVRPSPSRHLTARLR